MQAQEINDKLTMQQVWEFYMGEGIKRHKVCCPLHGEKTPSMHLYERSFYCFACGAAGDCIKFVQLYFGIDFRAAIVRLDYDFHLGLQLGQKTTRRQRHAMALQARQQQRAQAAKAEAQQVAERQYWALWAEWARLDNNRRTHRPTYPDEPLHPLFAEAICRIDYIEYQIDTLT